MEREELSLCAMEPSARALLTIEGRVYNIERIVVEDGFH